MQDATPHPDAPPQGGREKDANAPLQGGREGAGGSRRAALNVGLVQINNRFSGQNYLPLSVGTLQAYAQRHLSNPAAYRFLLPVYSRGPIEPRLDALRAADVVLFSAYVWNFRISLELARRLKAAQPETLVVFGGPHVPNRMKPLQPSLPKILSATLS